MHEPGRSEEMLGLVNKSLEPSAWLEITQHRVNQFADVTNDHQFIHVDPEKASQTQFGGTIAHGYLLLSLLPCLLTNEAFKPEDLAVSINYGLDRVRFLRPVRVGSQIRARQKITAVEEKKAGHWRVRTEATLEVKGENQPAMIAELITLLAFK